MEMQGYILEMLERRNDKVDRELQKIQRREFMELELERIQWIQWRESLELERR